MENRIIEIAQKKARHQTGKSFHSASAAGGRGPNRAEAMFFAPPDARASGIRFPPDIRPEKRAVGTTTLAFVLAAPAVEEKAPSPRKAKTTPKRKAAAKVKRSRARPRGTKAAAKSAPKAKAAAKVSAAMTGAPPPPAAVTPVPDLEPPFIPTPVEVRTALPRAQSVALYRKNGLLDVIGYWLRSGWAGLARSFKVARSSPQTGQGASPPRRTSVAQLLAENAALRNEVARLRGLNGASGERAGAA